ncbi:uncharacterized protein LOC127082379 [Lathyrus oleraceus]|uniref:uncharacterized protein LOC127082379 n=1 Tax=Pisum sativum TaxID=3888 RepID=UPI0021CE99ED|nr:uncharacterized protein LOC127082379 [Pisum sativum]
MTYTELFPSLIKKNLVQARTPPVVPKEILWWYKHDQHCAFHQGAPDHDIENCFSLKAEVRRLMQSGILSFEHSSPNVQANLLPKHGSATVNMVEGCPGKYRVFDVNLIRRSLFEMHVTLCELSYYEHDHVSLHIHSRNPRGCVVVKRDLQEMLDQNLIQITRDRNEEEHEVNIIVPRFNIPEPVVIVYNGQKPVVSPLVIRLTGLMPYESYKVVPYKYSAAMVEDAPKRTEDVNIEKPTQEKTHVMQAGQSSIVNQSSDQDEMLKSIKKSDFNAVDQLLHTSSKLSVLSLLMSSEAHREALQKVLEKAYVDHDITIDPFDGILANITACNNLSFSNEELIEQGRNHNLALHISMNYQEDVMSNVLVDTSSSLNVLPKTTMSNIYD